MSQRAMSPRLPVDLTPLIGRLSAGLSSFPLNAQLLVRLAEAR